MPLIFYFSWYLSSLSDPEPENQSHQKYDEYLRLFWSIRCLQRQNKKPNNQPITIQGPTLIVTGGCRISSLPLPLTLLVFSPKESIMANGHILHSHTDVHKSPSQSRSKPWQ